MGYVVSEEVYFLVNVFRRRSIFVSLGSQDTLKDNAGVDNLDNTLNLITEQVVTSFEDYLIIISAKLLILRIIIIIYRQGRFLTLDFCD